MAVSFLSNHDMDRIAGAFVLENNMKMAANLYLLSPGSPFIYYGEEIGIRGSRGGESTDANRRLAMLWGDEDLIRDPVGTTYDASKQIQTTVADQLADENSMLRYYCRLISIRTRYKEIPRGNYEVVNLGSAKCGGFRVTHEGSTLYILHNISTDLPFTVDVSEAGLGSPELCEVIGMSEATLEGSTLTVGPQTSIILRPTVSADKS